LLEHGSRFLFSSITTDGISLVDQPGLAAGDSLWGDLEVTKFFGGPFSNEEIQRRLQTE